MTPRDSTPDRYGFEGATITAAPRSTDVAGWISHVQQVRLRRSQRHFAVAGLVAVILGFVAPFAHTLPGVVLVPVLCAVILQSLARGIDARIGEGWGRVYPEPRRETRLDRAVHRLISQPPDDPVDEAVRVRPLDPWET